MTDIKVSKNLKKHCKDVTNKEWDAWLTELSPNVQHIMQYVGAAGNSIVFFLHRYTKAERLEAMQRVRDSLRAALMWGDKECAYTQDECEERRAYIKCGGRNGTVIFQILQDVIAQLAWNHGKVTEAFMANLHTALYRSRKEISIMLTKDRRRHVNVQ